MKELEGLNATDSRFDQLVSQLAGTIRHHVEEEESDLFPRLRAACPREELIKWAGKVEAAKKIAPTHAHPAAPDRPPANKVLAPGTGPVDPIRDALTGRSTSPEDVTK